MKANMINTRRDFLKLGLGAAAVGAAVPAWAAKRPELWDSILEEHRGEICHFTFG